MRSVLIAVGVVLWLASAAPALAQPQTQVERGLREFQELEFFKAIATLGPVTLAVDATPSQRLLALELIAISHLSLGDGPQAEVAFERLLHLRPDYQLRHHDDSPKVIAVFEKMRRRLARSGEAEPKVHQRARPVLSWGELASSRGGKRATITLEVSGRTPIEIRLWWKPDFATRYRSVSMRLYKGARWRARLPLKKRSMGYELLFYAEALGPAGEVLAQLGGAQPAVLAIAASSLQRQAWYQSWKVWAGVGVAAVLGGTAAILSTRSDSEEGSLLPGRITLSP